MAFIYNAAVLCLTVPFKFSQGQICPTEIFLSEDMID